VLTRIHQESKAGLAVGKLRTHPQKAVSDLAKEIVKEWKAEVERAKNKAAPAKQACTWEFQRMLTFSSKR
jgi:transcription elongation factor S-II